MPPDDSQQEPQPETQQPEPDPLPPPGPPGETQEETRGNLFDREETRIRIDRMEERKGKN